MSHLSPLERSKPTIISEDGTRIWAAQAGRQPNEAPVLVFVPGFACSSMSFIKQFEDTNLLDKFCMITYEPRGQGRSGQPLEKEAYTSKAFAEDFKAVCDAYGVKKVFLAGWSYGGLIPCDVFAHLGPEWIEGVILLAGIPWRSMHLDVAHPTVFDAIGPLLISDVAKVAKGLTGFVDSCFYPPNLGSIPYSLQTALVGAIAMQHPVARNLLLNEREQDPTKLLEYSHALNVILIVGEHDRHMYWDKLEAFVRKTFFRAEVKLVKDAGHAAFWEKTEEVNETIVKYVKRVSTRFP